MFLFASCNAIIPFATYVFEHVDIRDEIEVNMGVEVNIWDLWEEFYLFH